MPTWFNWTPIGPLIEYKDDGTRDVCEAEFSIEGAGNFKVAIVGTPQRIELIRVATLDSDGKLSPQQSEFVSKVVNHALSLLRLNHDANIDRLRFFGEEETISIGAHDVDGKPKMGIQIDEIGRAQKDVAPETFREVLVSSFAHQALFKLLSDAQMPLLPLQYRYLSLYKILELEFRSGKKWSGLDELLASYEEEYRALNVSPKALRNVLHEMRDKCAHIKVGGDDSPGILGLDHPDAKIVRALVGLLFRVVSNHLNGKKLGFKFELTPATDRREKPTVSSANEAR